MHDLRHSGRCQARRDGTMLRAMDASEGDLASRGYGATLWEPDDKTIRNARVTHFIRWLAGRGIATGGYQDLWQWSVTQPGEFWTAVWDYFDVLGDRGDGPALAAPCPRSAGSRGQPSTTPVTR